MGRVSPLTRHPLRFFTVRGHVEVQGAAPPSRSVLQVLREGCALHTGTRKAATRRLRGPCTVVIGELAKPVNPGHLKACVCRRTPLSVASARQGCHGETSRSREGASGLCQQACSPVIAPLQQAMVDCHGSQCGFCTPGIVMTLWSAYEHHQQQGSEPSRQQLADELSGNLCRCTGYRPILDAGQRMFDLPAVRLDTVPVVAALQGLRSEAGLHYAAVQNTRTDHFHAPRTLDELASLCESKPKARIVAGSTDVGLWVNKQFRDLGDMIYVGDVAEMKRIEVRQSVEVMQKSGEQLNRRWRPLEALGVRCGACPSPDVGCVLLRCHRSRPTRGGNVPACAGLATRHGADGAGCADRAAKGERVRRMPLQDFYLVRYEEPMESGELC